MNRVKSFFPICLLCCILNATGCATKTSGSSAKEEKSEAAEKVQHFEDWQYKGFGYEVPQTAEIVLRMLEKKEKTADEVEASLVESLFFPKDGSIFCAGTGENPDQAGSVMAESFEKDLSAFEEENGFTNLELTLEDSYWVKVNPSYETREKPYIAVKVYSTN